MTYISFQGFYLNKSFQNQTRANTNNKMLYAYATVDDRIKLVYSTEIESGFDSFSPTEIEIDELFSNIDEYIPHEYLRKDISETKTEQ